MLVLLAAVVVGVIVVVNAVVVVSMNVAAAVDGGAFFLAYGLCRGRDGRVVDDLLLLLPAEAAADSVVVVVSCTVVPKSVFCANAVAGFLFLARRLGETAESSGMGLPKMKSRICAFVTRGSWHMAQRGAGAW